MSFVQEDECLHGLVGCATCLGTDTDVLFGEVRSSALFEVSWKAEEIAFAADPTLTSGQVAGMTGRSAKSVAAYRIKQLGMVNWAGNNHTPGIPRRAVLV
jgi:hypothetical protein